MRTLTVFLATAAAMLAATERAVRVEDLDVSKIAQPMERPRTTGARSAVTIAGQKFERSVQTRAPSRLYIALDGHAVSFSAQAGFSDTARDSLTTFRGIVGEVRFAVYGDGKLLQRTGTVKRGSIAALEANLSGVHELLLAVDGPAGAYANWVDARITYTGSEPRTILPPEERSVDRTPHEPPQPRINGAGVVGIRPGTDFLYPIAATGRRPMTFAARGLPTGLRLYPKTGIISGRLPKPGEYAVLVEARNADGNADRKIRIIAGDRLALTPPMGWNAWNVIEGLVSETVLEETADAMVVYGFRDAGYQYVNIDDVWVIDRDADGRPVVDPVRFPHGIRKVANYLHARGLKLGVYSSPGPTTCARYPGSFEHEEMDVKTWTAWGVDYVKYDACSVPRDRKKELYLRMGDLLRRSGRSIIYSLSGGSPQWGEEAHAQLWRTTTDIRDQWHMKSPAGIIDNFDRQSQVVAYQHPGAWNDPDLLVIGIYGKGASSSDVGAKGSTDTEYRTQMSLWSLLSAPLMATADLRTISPAALETLTNPEVTDLDQDALGLLPKRCAHEGETEVWSKRLEDGSKAIALLNRGEQRARIGVKWADLGLSGPQRVRDLWKREECGRFSDAYAADVDPHATVLVRLWGIK